MIQSSPSIHCFFLLSILFHIVEIKWMLFHDVKWKIKAKKTTNRRHEQLTHLAWTCRRTPNPTCRVNLVIEVSLTPMRPMISTGRTQMALSDCFRERRAGDINSRARKEPRHAGWFEVLSGSDESWEWQAVVRRAANDTESGQRASVWLSRQGKTSERKCPALLQDNNTAASNTLTVYQMSLKARPHLQTFAYEIHEFISIGICAIWSWSEATHQDQVRQADQQKFGLKLTSVWAVLHNLLIVHFYSWNFSKISVTWPHLQERSTFTVADTG